jgi:hypothetical protein
VPMLDAVSTCPIMFTTPCRNYWSKGSLFVHERSEAGSSSDHHSNGADTGQQRHFIWQPELSDIKKAAVKSEQGEDLWASQHGYISCVSSESNVQI